jgi:putative hemolysin
MDVMRREHDAAMKSLLRRAQPRFPELSYASPAQPRLKRWFIRSVEELSGRDRFAALYDTWRRDVVPTGHMVFTRMLDLVGIATACRGAWPPSNIPDGPLVIVANHPFGIGDGIAILSLAEQLGRPFRVMIHADLLRVAEMKDYSLPIDFSETKEALKNNLAVRQEAMRLLKEGVVIVVFPAGGVATAPKGFGQARDLEWKLFPAKMIRDAQASVIPVHFSGQNGRLFHIASRVSLTIRTSLLIREFARLSGRTLDMTVGDPIPWQELAREDGRQALTRRLFDAVFALAPRQRSTRKPRHGRLAPADHQVA